MLHGGYAVRMDEQRLRRVVRQHAETARLMGVGFVPVFRTGAVGDIEIKPAATDPADAAAGGLARDIATGRDRTDAQRCLDEIRARYERDAPHQHFPTDHHSIVFGEGDPCARLMFVGEAPGAEEDKTGRPFVGRAGQLLDKMIQAMGLRREDVYITNVLKTRPPGNATPTVEESRLCAPYLMDQIRAIAPEVIVTLGRPATQLLLDTTAPMGRLRGLWATLRIEGDPFGEQPEFPVMPTYHPAFLLRQYTEENRRKVWSDLRQVIERLNA